jgi:uncharacterized protein
MTRLLLLILIFFLAYTVYTAIVRLLSKPAPPPPEKTLKGEDMVKDPICGVFLPRGDALPETIRGERHYFCSEACRDKFLEEDQAQ